jgi:tetratricopeptide (TPR) repeat protein
MTFSIRKFFVFSLLVTMGLTAWALPTPKDIETAVQAGQFSKAESMLREVIQEKPQSARAHYELGEVLAREARYPDALLELNKSRDLDPSLKFASDPQKFHELVDKINKLSASQQPSQAATNAVATVMASHTTEAVTSTPLWMWGLLIGAGVLVLLYFLNRPKPISASSYSVQPAVNPLSGNQAFGATPAYSGAPMSPTGSSPIAGAVVGGLAGVAAGYALSKALEGEHHSAADQPKPASNYDVTYDKPAAPDLGSFDSGSGGDSWDSSSGGSDDSW